MQFSDSEPTIDASISLLLDTYVAQTQLQIPLIVDTIYCMCSIKNLQRLKML